MRQGRLASVLSDLDIDYLGTDVVQDGNEFHALGKLVGFALRPAAGVSSNKNPGAKPGLP